MKLVCSREELSRALQAVSRSVGARAGIPALSGVLMELADELSLTTTDLELTTRVTLPVTGDHGQTVVPARLLSDVVRNLPGDDVEISRENGSVQVTGGRARFSLRSLPAEDFPRVHESDHTAELRLEADVVKRALGQVVVAASRDETRPVLTGVLLEGEREELRLVATDSYRLTLRRMTVPGCDGLRLLIPARAVQEVIRLIGSEPLVVGTGGAQVSFATGNVLLRSRLIEGDFPPYRRLMPEDLPNRFEAERAGFLESLRRIAVVAQDATPVFLELAESEIRLTCHSQGLGDATEAVDGEYRGDPVRVAFNPGYLQNGIDVIEGDRFRIELDDPQQRAVVRGTERDDFTYLLMPVRMT